MLRTIRQLLQKMTTTPKLNNLDIAYWQKRWEDNNIGWHRPQVNIYLAKFEDQFLTKPNSLVFVPLCGKTYDMIHMAEHGHRVVGLEFSTQAILDFFKEQGLEFSKSRVNDDFVLYEAKGKEIRIFQGDYFKMSSSLTGKVDAIWDRGSLVATNPHQRQAYCDIIKALSPSSYLIQGLLYDQNTHGGPPFCVGIDVVKELFQDSFDCQLLCNLPNPEGAERYNLEWFNDCSILLTSPKK